MFRTRLHQKIPNILTRLRIQSILKIRERESVTHKFPLKHSKLVQSARLVHIKVIFV